MRNMELTFPGRVSQRVAMLFPPLRRLQVVPSLPAGLILLSLHLVGV